MWSTIITSIAGAFSKEAFTVIGDLFKSSSQRGVFRRAIRDLVEDEIKDALLQQGMSREDIKKFTKDNERRLKKEIRARFDPVLQAKV